MCRLQDYFIHKAGVKGVCYLLFVEMLTDEDYLLHSVAVILVPVPAKHRVCVKHTLELAFRHCGIPLAGILE